MNWKIVLFCWTFFLQALNAQNLGAMQSDKYFPKSQDPTRFPIGCSPQVLKTQRVWLYNCTLTDILCQVVHTLRTRIPITLGQAIKKSANWLMFQESTA